MFPVKVNPVIQLYVAVESTALALVSLELYVIPPLVGATKSGQTIKEIIIFTCQLLTALDQCTIQSTH